MFMLTKTHTAAVKSLTADLEEARDEIAKLKGARRIDGMTVKDLEGKFKMAIVNLAAEVEARKAAELELSREQHGRASYQATVIDLRAELARLRPIAERAMQKAANDAARKRERRAAAPKPVAAKVKRGTGK